MKYKYEDTLLKEIYQRLTMILPCWFFPSWYKYLFSPWKGWRTVFCRAGGHKCGVVYVNLTGLEPDMSCKNCEDDLG